MEAEISRLRTENRYLERKFLISHKSRRQIIIDKYSKNRKRIDELTLLAWTPYSYEDD